MSYHSFKYLLEALSPQFLGFCFRRLPSLSIIIGIFMLKLAAIDDLIKCTTSSFLGCLAGSYVFPYLKKQNFCDVLYSNTISVVCLVIFHQAVASENDLGEIHEFWPNFEASFFGSMSAFADYIPMATLDGPGFLCFIFHFLVASCFTLIFQLKTNTRLGATFLAILFILPLESYFAQKLKKQKKS